jgi:prepilin-type N-terminal cleavage/methylation domain-containing protein
MVTRKRAGFTLVEIMVTTAVGAAVIAAAFTLASTQVRALNDHRQTGEMHANARMVFEAIAEDIRNAGFGTTFYAGVDEDTAFNQRAVVLDAATDPLGVPAIRVVDNVLAWWPTAAAGWCW